MQNTSDPAVRVFRHYNGDEAEDTNPPTFIVERFAIDRSCDPRASRLYYHLDGGPGMYWAPPTNGYYSVQLA